MPITLASLTPDVRKSNVAPIHAVLNVSDSLARDAVLLSDNPRWARVGSDGEHLFDREKGVGLLHALRLAALLRHVGHVLGMRTEEEMIEVDARGIVACGTIMQNEKTIGNRPVRGLPSETMCPVRFPLPFKGSVSRTQAAQPQTAPILVRFRRVMGNALCKRPVTRALKLFSLGFSHLSTSYAVRGQGRMSVEALSGPPILAVAA